MSNLSNQGSTQANSWAMQRKEAIEKAQKLRDARKYNLAMTGEMAINSHNDKKTGNTQTTKGTSKPSVPSTADSQKYGYRKAMTTNFEAPHEEEYQMAANSLKLLKSRSKQESYDALDDLNQERSNKYSNLGGTMPRKEMNKEDNSLRQPLNEVFGNQNQNYRKAFKPNLGGDSNTSGKANMNQPIGQSRGQAVSSINQVDDRKLRTIPVVQEDEDTGFSTSNMPSRIPKNTLGHTKGKGQGYEDEYMQGKGEPQVDRRPGAKRERQEQNMWGHDNESPINDYKPSSKQQYRPREEKEYNPSNYSGPQQNKGTSKDYLEYGNNKNTYQPTSYGNKGYQEKVAENRPQSKQNLQKPSYSQNPRQVEEKPQMRSRQTTFETNQEGPQGIEPLIECPEGCGRKFFASVVEKHARACVKVFQTKRKEFNIANQRLTEDQLKLTTEKKPGPSRLAPSKTMGTTGAGAIKPASKKGKWKQQSEAFRANLKAARGEKLSREEEITMARNDDLVQCDSCFRRFNEEAAKRHIPFCKSKQKIESLKRPPAKTTKSKK